MSEAEKQFGRLRLSAQGTNNGRGFDIFYDFGGSFDFADGKTKPEFYFIQPWMQFPHAKYTEECMLVSIELVRRFNEFKSIERQLQAAEKEICRLNKKLEQSFRTHEEHF